MKNTPDHHDHLKNADTVLEIGARIEKRPSQQMLDTVYQRELEDQLILFDALSLVDLAHTLAMTDTGLIPRPVALQLLTALKELQGHPDDFQPGPMKGDLYTNRECWLLEQTPAGKWLGCGRARREAITTAYVVKLRRDFISLTESLVELGQTIIAQASLYMNALMPDYTYLQKAQPTSFGHFLLGFSYPLLRDIERIKALYSRLNQSPAGCGSSNGSRLQQPREQISHLLGFEGLVQHARDAMWQADLQIEMVAVLTAININLDRLAEDMLIFMTEEFGLLDIDDQHARASKIMPQKKNPFALTHIRGMANTMIGQLASSAAMGRTPSGQPDNRLSLYGLVPKSLLDTKNTVMLMNEVMAFCKFNITQGREKLNNSFALATDLAEVLVIESGLSFRDAHRLVGLLTRNHQGTGNFKKLTVKEVTDTSETLLGIPIELDPTVFSHALNPDMALSVRDQPGGAATSSVTDMIHDCGRILTESCAWSIKKRFQLDAAETRLNEKVHEYLSSGSWE